jgi:hypothetical protein
LAVVAQPKPVLGCGHARDRPGGGADERPDHQAPVAVAGRAERDGGNGGHHRVHRHEDALAGVLHLAVWNPGRRLERGQEHRRGQDDAGQDDLGAAVGDREDRQRQAAHREVRGGHRELERERLLERGLLVRLGLLDVLVGDADLLKPGQRDQRREDDPPEPELLAGEERGDGKLPHQAETSDPGQEGGVDQCAARSVDTQVVDTLLEPSFGNGLPDGVAPSRRVCPCIAHGVLRMRDQHQRRG